MADQDPEQGHAYTVDLRPFMSDVDPVECQQWDVGTGVAGFVWHAPNAHAAVLFQHGWGDYTQRHVHAASELIPRLLQQGFSVYGFDMWGNGRSPGKRGVVDVQRAVTDHLAARSRLRDQHLPVFLMGHSLGGLVTATSTVRDQSDVAGVVLLAPALKYDVSPALRLVARLGGFIVPTLRAPLRQNDITRDASAQKRFDRDPLVSTRGGVRWLTAAGGATVSHQNWPLYPMVRTPVLAVHGSADAGTDPSGSSDLVECLGSDDKQLYVVDGGYHALLDDFAASETLDVVLRWLHARSDAAR